VRSFRLLAALLALASPARAATLRVMSYNAHSCKGWDRRVKPERIARVIAAYKPDVVALQEVRVGKIDQPSVIAEALGMRSVFTAFVHLPDEDYGIAVLSRRPLRVVRAEPFPATDGRPYEPRGALWVELDVEGRKVQLLDTHLGLHADERAFQAETLAGREWLGSPAFARPFVVCGDLNSSPTETAYRKLSRLAEDAVGKAARGTFPSLMPFLRIDHVFASAGLAATAVPVSASWSARLASDHLPVVVDLTLP
jgi:endonuclease/exonuclease/phosphatase family metal-dependent hydrolase